MTTLELARAIADAVLAGFALARPIDSRQDPYTQAVLRTLEQHDSWFCTATEDADGITVETPYPRQSELFK